MTTDKEVSSSDPIDSYKGPIAPDNHPDAHEQLEAAYQQKRTQYLEGMKACQDILGEQYFRGELMKIAKVSKSEDVPEIEWMDTLEKMNRVVDQFNSRE
jgi:hypothetical protein